MQRNEMVKKIMDQTSIFDRFLKYVKIDTQADPESETFPSSEKEKDLGRVLASELEELGLEKIEMDENGYIYATMPENNGSDAKIAYIAHMDVAPDCKGEGVNPQIHKNYDGTTIKLPSGDEITPSISVTSLFVR